MIKSGFIIIYKQGEVEGYCPIVAPDSDDAREAFLLTAPDDAEIQHVFSFSQLQEFRKSLLELSEKENLAIHT